MKYLSSQQIYEKFLEFFKELNHEILPSFSLIPQNDNSILYVNAGVTPIKNYFTGIEVPSSKRIAFCQKVVRTNDLEEIGKSGFHLSFFEMLGNFSIGNYFKKHAIYFAFKFLTDKKYLNIPRERLYVTVLENDSETLQEWKTYLNENQIILSTKKTNFWDLKKGPCGPCTEIFYDLFLEIEENPLILKTGNESKKFLEIWNIVFSEFNNDGFNNFIPLNQKNIDTGAGLERLAVVLQQKSNVFETDFFAPLIEILETKSILKYDSKNLKVRKVYWTILDHIRTIVFLINENITCSGKGRGYVLNKLIKKTQLLLTDLSIDLIEEQEKVLKLLVKKIYEIYGKRYEFNFSVSEVLKKIIIVFDKFKLIITKTKNLINFYQKNNLKIDHHLAFKLHDTYGFPLDELKNLFFDLNININWINFKKLETEHILLSKKNQNFTLGMDIQPDLAYFLKKYEFNNDYEIKTLENSKLILIFNHKFEVVDHLKENDLGYFIFEKTCFYPESAGQIFDIGIIFDEKSKAEVINVQKWFYNSSIHEVKIVKNNFFQNKNYKMRIDYQRREAITKNHSATHLINHFLLKNFSKKIYQNGSFIDEKKLKFDFFSDVLITKEQIKELNFEINDYLKQSSELKIFFEDYENLKNDQRIVKNFPFKYNKKVRVVNFGANIFELCTGTHVKNLQEIENIFIYEFKKIGENNYRIMATSSIKNSENIFKEIKNNLIYKYKKLYNLFSELPDGLKDEFLKNNSILMIQNLIDDLKNLNFQTKILEKDIEAQILLLTKKIKKMLEKKSSSILSTENNFNLFYQNCSVFNQKNPKILVSVVANLSYNLIKKFLKKEIKNFDIVFVNNLIFDKWQVFCAFSLKNNEEEFLSFKDKLINFLRDDFKINLKIKDNFSVFVLNKEKNGLFFSLLKTIY